MSRHSEKDASSTRFVGKLPGNDDIFQMNEQRYVRHLAELGVFDAQTQQPPLTQVSSSTTDDDFFVIGK